MKQAIKSVLIPMKHALIVAALFLPAITITAAKASGADSETPQKRCDSASKAAAQAKPDEITQLLQSNRAAGATGKPNEWLTKAGALGPTETKALSRYCVLRSLGQQTALGGRKAVLEGLKGEAFALDVIREAGDVGIAALLEMQLGSPDLKNRGWASGQLELLGKRTASDVVQMKDASALVNVLDAYGAAKNLDALPVILSLVSADNTSIREASRKAVLAYGRDAVFKTKEVYQTLTGRSGEALDFETLAKGIFEATDKLRTRDVDTRLDDGLLRLRNGELAAGLSAIEDSLARQPGTARKAELVSALLEAIDRLIDTDRPLARQTLERTLRLSANSPRENAVRARLVYLDAEERTSLGPLALRPLYERAMTLDPNFSAPRQRVNQLDDVREEFAKKSLWWPLAAGALVLAVALAILFVRPLRRKPA